MHDLLIPWHAAGRSGIWSHGFVFAIRFRQAQAVATHTTRLGYALGGAPTKPIESVRLVVRGLRNPILGGFDSSSKIRHAFRSPKSGMPLCRHRLRHSHRKASGAGHPYQFLASGLSVQRQSSRLWVSSNLPSNLEGPKRDGEGDEPEGRP
jgi:hypothetical protein